MKAPHRSEVLNRNHRLIVLRLIVLRHSDLDALGYAVVRKDVYRTAALTLTMRGDLAALGDCDDIAV